MFFERKAYIEFINSDYVRITTPYCQKYFELKINSEKLFCIDLIKLKMINIRNSSFSDLSLFPKFYAIVCRDLESQEFSLEIFSNKLDKYLDTVNFSERNKLIKTKIKDD